jgi:hypothetical protein
LVKETIIVVNLEFDSKHLESVQAMHLCDCHDPSFGLATKAKAWKNAS